MPRPSNTDERRAQIADAFKRLLAREGYDGATVQQIAAEAGLTAGLVHYHFESKLEILLVVLDRLILAHDAAVASALERGSGDPVEDVGAFIDLHLAVGGRADPEAVACWIVIVTEALRREPVRERFSVLVAGMTDRLARLIARGVEAGAFACAPGDVDAAACALMAAIQGYFTMAAAARSLIPRGSAAEATRRMADGILKPARPLSRAARDPLVGLASAAPAGLDPPPVELPGS
jgi:TetR/AcrR family transcriptional repressor of bet genes